MRVEMRVAAGETLDYIVAIYRARFKGFVSCTGEKGFPQNIFAGMFGFSEKGYFKADVGSENVPKVEF